MNGNAHLAMGVFLGLMVVYMKDSGAPESIAIVASSAGASLFPDLDAGANRSKIGSKFPVIASITRFIFGHRGFFHSLILLAILIWIFRGQSWGIGVTAGFSGHLVQDVFTSGGVPLFYPLKKRLSLSPFDTGGISDWVITILLMVFVIGVCV